MAERRRLIEGLSKPTDEELAFIKGELGKPSASVDLPATPPAASAAGKAPISTRIRADIATALKRASLERQLSKIEPNTMSEILEEAVEPWLKAKGYLT